MNHKPFLTESQIQELTGKNIVNIRQDKFGICFVFRDGYVYIRYKTLWEKLKEFLWVVISESFYRK
jgi:hypothetical protein